MIRFRPCRGSMSASFKGELVFSDIDELLRHVHDRWSRVVAFMGGAPFRPEEITVGASAGCNPVTGYRDERTVSVSRMRDRVYPVPMCIGFCDLGNYMEGYEE